LVSAYSTFGGNLRIDSAPRDAGLLHLPQLLLVTARVSGTFPGSPIELRYAFTLRGGQIVRQEIV